MTRQDVLKQFEDNQVRGRVDCFQIPDIVYNSNFRTWAITEIINLNKKLNEYIELCKERQ